MSELTTTLREGDWRYVNPTARVLGVYILLLRAVLVGSVRMGPVLQSLLASALATSSTPARHVRRLLAR